MSISAPAGAWGILAATTNVAALKAGGPSQTGGVVAYSALPGFPALAAQGAGPGELAGAFDDSVSVQGDHTVSGTVTAHTDVVIGKTNHAGSEIGTVRANPADNQIQSSHGAIWSAAVRQDHDGPGDRQSHTSGLLRPGRPSSMVELPSGVRHNLGPLYDTEPVTQVAFDYGSLGFVAMLTGKITVADPETGLVRTNMLMSAELSQLRGEVDIASGQGILGPVTSWGKSVFCILPARRPGEVPVQRFNGEGTWLSTYGLELPRGEAESGVRSFFPSDLAANQSAVLFLDRQRMKGGVYSAGQMAYNE